MFGHPALQDLPVILEVPGSGDGPDEANMAHVRILHAEGLALRK